MSEKYNNELEAPLSIGGWFGTIVLMCIPGVNLIAMIAYACGAGKNRSRTNFFRLELILSAVGIIGIVILILVSGMSLSGYLETLQSLMGGSY